LNGIFSKLSIKTKIYFKQFLFKLRPKIKK